MKTQGFGFGLMLLALIGLTGCFSDPRQAPHLASWSPIREEAAFVPSSDESGEGDSGVWILNASFGEIRQIVTFADGSRCLQPQWSSDGSEILFCRLEPANEGTNLPEGQEAYSIWRVRRDGEGLVRLAGSTVDEENIGLLLPNAVMWGPWPGTVIMHRATAEGSIAMLLETSTGWMRPILPKTSEAYVIRLSPLREKAAALLFNDETVEIYLADFANLKWRKLDVLKYDDRHLSSLSPEVYWAHDSSQFVIPEEYEDAGDTRHALRVFDAFTGESRRLDVRISEPPILWSKDGTSLLFSDTRGTEGDYRNGIYRIDIRTGWLEPIVADGEQECRLLSQDPETGKIFFYRETRKKKGSGGKKVREVGFYSCASDGTEVVRLAEVLLGKEFEYMPSRFGSKILLFSDLPHVTLLDLEAKNSSLDILLTP